MSSSSPTVTLPMATSDDGRCIHRSMRLASLSFTEEPSEVGIPASKTQGNTGGMNLSGAGSAARSRSTVASTPKPSICGLPEHVYPSMRDGSRSAATDTIRTVREEGSTEDRKGRPSERDIRLFTTCPPSTEIDQVAYLEAGPETSLDGAKTLDSMGSSSTVTTGFWIRGCSLTSSFKPLRRLMPLVAVQPLYMHPFTAAKSHLDDGVSLWATHLREHGRRRFQERPDRPR